MLFRLDRQLLSDWLVRDIKLSFYKIYLFVIVKTVLWTFDNTLNDVSGQFNGTGRNSPTYVSGINGYGSALALNGATSQCAIVTPYLNMSYISFTWEFWVYPTVTPSGDSMFIGQCGAATDDQCLIVMTRSDVMWFAFWNDDANGTTNIAANKWCHMTFIYDYAANKKIIYLNGIFEGTQDSKGPLHAGSTFMTFGCRTTNGGGTYSNSFTGYIDQMLYNSRVKNASEILDDATLVVYYRFLLIAPLIDSGPNYINGTWGGGTVSIGSGIVDEAINFPMNGSYFLVTGLVLLGTSYSPFSLSLWFQTTSLNGDSIIVYKSTGIASNGSCSRFIGLTASGNVEIQIFNGVNNTVLTGPVMPIGIWNYVVYTFSTTNGMRLYINGTLYGSITTAYSASGTANILIFGNPSLTNYSRSSLSNEQFYGSVDEVRLYSRELTASEISQLYSNP
jgi:hypothetical protein